MYTAPKFWVIMLVYIWLEQLALVLANRMPVSLHVCTGIQVYTQSERRSLYKGLSPPLSLSPPPLSLSCPKDSKMASLSMPLDDKKRGADAEG